MSGACESRVDRVAMFHLAEALWPESLELLAWLVSAVSS